MGLPFLCRHVLAQKGFWYPANPANPDGPLCHKGFCKMPTRTAPDHPGRPRTTPDQVRHPPPELPGRCPGRPDLNHWFRFGTSGSVGMVGRAAPGGP
jgi:hypothetical protein